MFLESMFQIAVLDVAG